MVYLHFPDKNVITDLVIPAQVIPFKNKDFTQVTIIKISQGIKITIRKIHRKLVVIAVVAVLGGYQWEILQLFFVVIIEHLSELGIIRHAQVFVHQLTGGKCARDQQKYV